MTPADQAAWIWRMASAAAHSLAGSGLERPTISLGPGISEALAEELARVSGGRYERYRAADAEETSLVKVCWSVEAYPAGVYVYGLNSRPATGADESIPLRGGRA